MCSHGTNSDTYLRITEFAQRRMELINRAGSIFEFTQILNDKTVLAWATKMPSLRAEMDRGQTSVMGQVILPQKFKTQVNFEIAEEPNQTGNWPLYLQLTRNGSTKKYLLWMAQDKDQILMVFAGCFESEEALNSKSLRGQLIINLAAIVAKEILHLNLREADLEEEEAVIWQ